MRHLGMVKKPKNNKLLRTYCLSCCFSLFLYQVSFAEEQKSVPDKQEQASRNALIGNISYEIGDVFDLSNPKENNFAFRLINLLHFKTRQFVIKDQLLFKTNAPYSAQLIEETERNLRSNRYIYDAWLISTAYQDDNGNDKVDVQVKTQDTWTLSLGFTFGSAGGESDKSVFIEDRNLFGLGTRLTLVRSSDVDREESRISYKDNNITGRHIVFGFDYSNNSDGYFRALELQRPFYAFNVTDAYSTKISAKKLTEKLYTDGSITDQYQRETSNAAIFYGFSKGLVRNRTLRWQTGINYSENQFKKLDDGILTNPLPTDNKLIYPWLGANYIQNNYIKTKNFLHILRTEDVNIGRDFSGSIGLTSTAWGSDRNGIILSASMNDAYRLNTDQLLLWTISGSGRMVSNAFQNSSAYANAQYHAPNFANQAFYTEFTFNLLHNPDENNQLLMGGNNGLPGYPLRLQSGNRSVLFSVEQRYYTNLHLLQLIRVGGALFFNSGSAWSPGNDDQQFELLSDVGFGLRLESSRSESGTTLHLDMALPLNRAGEVNGWQFSIATRSTL